MADIESISGEIEARLAGQPAGLGIVAVGYRHESTTALSYIGFSLGALGPAEGATPLARRRDPVSCVLDLHAKTSSLLWEHIHRHTHTPMGIPANYSMGKYSQQGSVPWPVRGYEKRGHSTLSID